MCENYFHVLFFFFIDFSNSALSSDFFFTPTSAFPYPCLNA